MESTSRYQTQRHEISGKTVLFATVAGITIGGPLLALMGFSFLATMALFVVTSPLLLIFSPLLMGASFVLVAALVGFGAAGVLAVGGLTALGWVYRSMKGDGTSHVTGRLEEVDENLKDTGKDWASRLKQTVENSPENITANIA